MVETLGDSTEVADSVTIGVSETLWVDLVDDGRTPPNVCLTRHEIGLRARVGACVAHVVPFGSSSMSTTCQVPGDGRAAVTWVSPGSTGTSTMRGDRSGSAHRT